MKKLSDMRLGDFAWVIDHQYNIYEIKMIGKDTHMGFCDNIICLIFEDTFDREIMVTYIEDSPEADNNYAYTQGIYNKVYIEKESVLKELNDIMKRIGDTINHLENKN